MAKQTKEPVPPKRRDHDRRCNYRVVKIGCKYRVQTRSFFFIWRTVRERTAFPFVYKEISFSTLTEAEMFIERRKQYFAIPKREIIEYY